MDCDNCEGTGRVIHEEERYEVDCFMCDGTGDICGEAIDVCCGEHDDE